MGKIKFIGRTIYWLIAAALLVAAGFLAVSALDIPGNYKVFIVLSGSMEPTIKTGSVVIVKPEKNYGKGDVITFQDPARSKTPITHRIFEASGSAFLTKGDANKNPDLIQIHQGQILGKEILAVAYVGYVISFAKTRQGFLILVIIPAVVIIYNELLTIKNEVLRLIRERRNA